MSQIVEYNEDNASDYEWFDGFAVIRFYADWCAPCMQNFPVFEQCAKQMSAQHTQLKFGKVNIDSSPILTLRYKVYGLPSTLLFYRGQVIQRIAGVKLLSELTTIIQSAMRTHSDND
ncbi:thioredoxin family protein [Acinetobacter sp. SH20PTE14]|uniref:thioredoxin family protein n=1 Tax=Acinetobacter sp. SH20PTE14 TaxID=2905879 RepID=UPI001F22C275|nr:thioredoxin family protein [Acinetobacter sp. SH20PTE14]UIJ74915.1 thioredoxin family protein [Acinetobacter sp. SH20PTE14]